MVHIRDQFKHRQKKENVPNKFMHIWSFLHPYCHEIQNHNYILIIFEEKKGGIMYIIQEMDIDIYTVYTILKSQHLCHWAIEGAL